MEASIPGNNLPSQRLARSTNTMATSALPFDRTRSEASESWIEIGSRPSSSSLSSAADEIVTTGLRVQELVRRRRRPRNTQAHPHTLLRPGNAGDISSQEEYEESESESDRVMTSSNEGIVMGVSQGQSDHAENVYDSDDDENRTAVNYPIRTTQLDTSGFTPQPNAFSHPPRAQTVRTTSEPGPASYFTHRPTQSDQRPATRHSFSTQDARSRSITHNLGTRSQNAAAHHDAALRASLSTLLSCAAAARGLPKVRCQQTTSQPLRPSNRVETATLRLIPESALPGARSPASNNAPEPSFQPTLRQRSSSSGSGSQDDPQKRKTNVRNSSKDRRLSKKPRRASSASSAASTVYSSDDVFVSPTLLTWLVSAGVVVVLSAISFTAGYSVGREVGHAEAVSSMGTGAVDVGSSCAAEAGRSGMGLRRLRFTAQA